MMRALASLGRCLVLSAVVALALSAPASANGSWCHNTVPPSSPPPPWAPPPICRECGQCQRSPCFVGTGSYTRSATDLSVPTTGFPLELSRNYDSTDLVDGPLGYGWSTSLVPRAHLAVYAIAQGGTVQSEADITMPDGERLRFSENADGSFTPPTGRFDILVKNADGTFDLTLQHTRSVAHFNLDGSLGWIADDYGNKLIYTYDANGQLQEVADGAGSGRYLDVYWGADGRISSVVDNAGRSINYQYDATGHLITVTNPLGQNTNYSYTPGKYVGLLSEVRDNWDRVITTITWDSQDRVDSYTENGETWTYTYDYGGDPSKTAKTDSAGNRWIFTSGPDGQVTSEVAPDGSTKVTSYYADGLPQLYTDEMGVKTSFTYDSTGRVLTQTKDDGGSEAIRLAYAYDSNFPEEVTSTTPLTPSSGELDPNWQGSLNDYYQPGSAAPGATKDRYLIENDGQTKLLIESLTYDTAGRPLSSTDAEGQVTNYTYDSSGNLSEVDKPSNNDAGTRRVSHFDHNSLGRTTSYEDPTGAITTYTYDALGRVTSITQPKPTSNTAADFTTSISYDQYDASTGLTFTVVTDPNGHTWLKGRDQFGRLVQLIDALGHTTYFSYEGDELRSVTDANGYAELYSYDSMHRVIRYDFPDGTFDSFTYYPDGILHTRTNRRGQTFTLSHDALKRILTVTYPDSSGVAYTYVGQKLAKVLDTHNGSNEAYLFTYGPDFRIQQEAEGSRGTLTYTHTASGLVSSVAILNGPTTTYTRYPDGSVDTIAWSEVPGEFKYSYNLRGQVESILFPNGQLHQYSYDNQGRELSTSTMDPIGATIASFTYSYDVDQGTGAMTELGQRTAVSATVPALALSTSAFKFSYDEDYRLTGVDYPATTRIAAEQDRWSYDSVGNRTSESVDGSTEDYTYQQLGQNAENWQRLLAAGATSYTYDADGNTVSRDSPNGLESFAWTGRDQLEGLSGLSSASYTYSYDGQRITASENGESSNLLYNGSLVVGKLGTSTTWYLFGPRSGQPLARSIDGNISYYATDALNSVVAVVDPSGSVQKAYSYGAWGRVRDSEGSASEDFGFTGHLSAPGGLWYFGARYYDPSIGRFVSPDPLVWTQGFLRSLYSYVHGNPVLFVDPNGLQEVLDPWGQPPLLPNSPSGPTPPGPECHPIGPPYLVDRYKLFEGSHKRWDFAYERPQPVPGPAEEPWGPDAPNGGFLACVCYYYLAGWARDYELWEIWAQDFSCPACQERTAEWDVKIGEWQQLVPFIGSKVPERRYTIPLCGFCPPHL